MIRHLTKAWWLLTDEEDAAEEELEELESLASLRMNVNTYSDYYPDQPTEN